MVYNVSVKSAMGFIVLRSGNESSSAVFILMLTMPDKKERKSVLNMHSCTFVVSVSLGIEPIQRPKAVPNRFAYINSGTVTTKSVMRLILSTSITKPIYKKFDARLKQTKKRTPERYILNRLMGAADILTANFEIFACMRPGMEIDPNILYTDTIAKRE